jgi:hypothetical protein
VLKELGKQLELPAACTQAIDPASAFSLAVAGLLAADGGASLLSLNRRSSTLPDTASAASLSTGARTVTDSREHATPGNPGAIAPNSEVRWRR